MLRRMPRRHSWVSCFGAVAVIGSAACATSTGNNEHGPAFGGDGSAEGGDDAEASTSEGGTDASVEGSSGTDAMVHEGGGPADATTDSTMGLADTGGPPVDASDGGVCGSTMGLVAMGASTIAEARFASGHWSIATAAGQGGTAPPAVPALAALGSGYLAAYVGPGATFAPLEATGYAGAWSTPAQIGAATAQGSPILATTGATAHVVYWGSDGKFYHGVYAGSWNAGNEAVEPDGGAQSFGSSGPAAAMVGSTLVVAQAGSNGVLYDQTWSGGTWQPASAHAGPSLVTTIAPAMVALTGGSAELLLVYVRAGDANDYHLEYTTRTGGTWSSPAEVYDSAGMIAYAGTTPSLAALPGGGAIVAWQGGAPASPYASLFNGTSWSAPAAVASTLIGAPPTVAAGVCGATAVAAFVDASGQVDVATLTGTTWSSPLPIADATGMRSVAIASSP